MKNLYNLYVRPPDMAEMRTTVDRKLSATAMSPEDYYKYLKIIFNNKVGGGTQMRMPEEIFNLQPRMIN